MALVYTKARDYKNISRYGIYRQISDTSINQLYLESTNKIFIDEDSVNDKFHIVDVSEENRLDIISQIYYGTPTLNWAIAMANNMIDPLILVPGTVLRIPNYASLYKTGGPLISRG